MFAEDCDFVSWELTFNGHFEHYVSRSSSAFRNPVALVPRMIVSFAVRPVVGQLVILGSQHLISLPGRLELGVGWGGVGWWIT